MKFYRQSIALFFTAAIAAGCGNKNDSSRVDIASPVSVTELKPSSISKYITTSGTARATFEVDLKSEMAGNYALSVNPATGSPFKLGDKVSKGQVVVTLDNLEYENGIAIDAKKLSLDLALQEQQKQKELYEKGGVTLSELRNTEVKVTNAKYEYENAQIRLSKRKIIAPISGTIVTLPYYTPGSMVESGSPMISIMDYSKMFVDINLPESAINETKVGQGALITHYTLLYDTIPGSISELSPAVSMDTRTFAGKLLIDNKKLLLRPGMFVKADIMVDRVDGAIVIPKNTVMSNRRRKYVFIIEKNTAVMRDIKTGIEDEDNIQILDGLKENDNLVTRGQETLREDSKVKIQK